MYVVHTLFRPSGTLIVQYNCFYYSEDLNFILCFYDQDVSKFNNAPTLFSKMCVKYVYN